MDALLRRMFFLVFCALALLAEPATGPLFAEGTWVPAGPEGGLAWRLAIHPGNPRILWAGTSNAGIFKSVDGGATWAPSNQGLEANLNVQTLAVAPSDPDILYAAAGFYSTVGGVFRSSDGGRTWTAMLSCPPNPLIGLGCLRLIQTFDLDIDPRNPQILYASTRKGVFKSFDGGRRWSKTGRSTFANATRALAIDPGNPRVLYAGGNGMEKSEDGGQTWAPLRQGMGFVPIEEIVIDPRNPQRIWVGAAVDRGVYWTADGGAHWRRARSGLPGRRVNALALSPRPGQGFPIVVAGTDAGAFRSLDGGLTWSAAPDLFNLRISDLASHPSRPGIFWAAGLLSLRGDRVPGIYKSGNNGATWRLSSRGLFGVPTEVLAFDPVTPGVLWAGSQEAGVFRSQNSGSTWAQLSGDTLGFQFIYDLAVDPRDPETVWIATHDGVWVTEDGGATWEKRSEGLLPPDTGIYPIFQLQLAPSDPSTAYASGPTRIFRTVDGGEHWTDLNLPGSPFIWDILVDPDDPETVFVAAGDLQVSRDGGATWQTVPVWNAPTVIQTLAADPRNPDVLYAGGMEGLFRSTDGGQTWQSVAFFPVAGVTELAVGPAGEVWVIAEGRIYRSADGTEPWIQEPGLTGISILEIAVDPHDPDGVFLGTTAGIFRFLEGD